MDRGLEPLVGALASVPVWEEGMVVSKELIPSNFWSNVRAGRPAIFKLPFLTTQAR